MYSQLGDIKFEGLIGFESFTDTIDATYAQHELVNRKPRLQRTGDALQEISGSISFHASFCDPEAQYAKLKEKKVSGEVLSLIYGNGIYEGDFVLKTIKRTVNQTDPSGNYVSISCEITLLEAEGNTAAQRREQDKASAFAVTSNRPLPVNRKVTDVSNPALDVANNNKVASQSGNAIAGGFDTVDKQIKRLANTVNPAIQQAQLFLQVAPSLTARINRYINNLDNALQGLTALMGANPTINSYAPTLSAKTNAAKAVLLTVQALMVDIANLPNVSTIADALYILNVQKNSVILSKQLVASLAELNTASSGIASVLASKVKVSA